jgi:hypothetical protein
MRTNRFLLFASHYGKDIGKYLFFNQSETSKLFSLVRGGTNRHLPVPFLLEIFFRSWNRDFVMLHCGLHTHVLPLVRLAWLRRAAGGPARI